MNASTAKQEAVFTLALGKPAAERGAFLDRECGGDGPLRQRLEALLAAHEQKDDVLATEVEAAIRPTLSVHVPEEPPDETVGQTLGRYKLLEKVGEGGCGVVYVAEQTEPVRRRVALKIIKLGMDTKQVVARFEAERQALAMMDHPNIAKILDAGITGEDRTADFSPQERPQREARGSEQSVISNREALRTEVRAPFASGRPYFVMELVRGIRITDYCDQSNLTTQERLDLFIKVCQAIQHAHQKGIIHRDIKPSNILVTLHDGVPVPKVIDFGIAKATEGRLTDATVYTQLHQFIGTPAYMSPEQAEMSGLDIDTRSDIYSLGVLLYELLAGSTPFDAKELMASGIDAMRKIIREKEPARPSTRLETLNADQLTTTAKHRSTDNAKLRHQLQGDLDWIVMKCLEKDRARRYETASGLAADLKRHLNNEPVVARPPSAAYRFQRAFRRNKAAFATATAVALALLLGAIASGWLAVIATEAKNEALVAKQAANQLAEQARQSAARADSERAKAETEQKRANDQARKAAESEQESRRLLYASDMNLAQHSLKLNNLGKARRLLDRNRPQHGEADLRGWEWRYLWRLTRTSALATLTNRPTHGFSVSFSPDGRRLAVGWFDGHVDLWDVPSRQLIRVLTDHDHPHQGRVAFSPVRNLLVATSEPKTVALYDLDSGQESILWRAPDQDEWDVRDLSFSPDGTKVIIYAGSDPVRDDTAGLRDSVLVVNVSPARTESRHWTVCSYTPPHHFGAAQISPDNQRLYLAHSDVPHNQYSIQCVDLSTGREHELWQTKLESDRGVTTLALSPDGLTLASGSGYEDSSIRVWDATSGRLLVRLSGHTGWVCKLVFSRDGRHLISAATDQSIRIWDTSKWTAQKVLHGHNDEVHAVAVSESSQLVASASKDGDLLLWNLNGDTTSDGYLRLAKGSETSDVFPMDQSRFLLLPPGGRPEFVDLKRDATTRTLPVIEASNSVLGCFGTNIFCYWNGTNQIVVLELRGAEFFPRGTIFVPSGIRPTGFTYNPTRQLLAWTEGLSSAYIRLAGLGSPNKRVELDNQVPAPFYLRFDADGQYLAAATKDLDSLRAWSVETGRLVASVRGPIRNANFVADGKVLVVATARGAGHEIEFHDLVHSNQPPWRVPGKNGVWSMAVSPDGGRVAASTEGGLVRLFDVAKREWVDLRGHMNSAFGVAFSPDGQRLISTCGGAQAVILWDVNTRQELLTLEGTGLPLGAAQWSADGDTILVGVRWQAWCAPSWTDIAAAETAPAK